MPARTSIKLQDIIGVILGNLGYQLVASAKLNRKSGVFLIQEAVVPSSKYPVVIKKESSLAGISNFFGINFSKGILAIYQKNRKWILASGKKVVSLEKLSLLPENRFGLPLAILNKDTFSVLLSGKALKFAEYSVKSGWQIMPRPILLSRIGYFDQAEIQPLGLSQTSNGYLLLYYCQDTRALGAVLFKTRDLQEVIFRTADPVWVFAEAVKPIAGIIQDNLVKVYYTKADKKVYCLQFVVGKVFGEKHPSPILERSLANPIIGPNTENEWESQYTFNTAIIHAKKKFHFIYRAVGDHGISVLGYANSFNGVDLDERFPRPVFATNHTPGIALKTTVRRDVFASGGSWGGCEDPRITRIGSKLYMTYTTLENPWGIPQVALSTIQLKDFLSHRWNWSKPIIISPPAEIHKNWVIFPEKINGKFAILHSIAPKVQIEYVDSLRNLNSAIKSRHAPETRAKVWDSRVRGVGSPPIRTSLGWLVFYHAVDMRHPDKYKMGAMILDGLHPEKILHRSNLPVLEPSRVYEESGFKPGIVYNCGAVVVKDILYVYYGAADTVVCLATAHLPDFLARLKADSQTEINNIFSINLI